MSATADLLDFVAAPHVLPPAARADALRLLADTLAVGVAGSTAPGAEGVRAAAAGWGAGDEARLIGFDGRLPAAGAAFANAFAIHCLEWDAVHEPAVVHALSVVTAALAAAIDRMGGVDPEAALTALAVGVEVASGLGVAAESGLRFFRPATAGLVGAALAVARIEGLPRGRLDDVLGLAVAFCAGTMQAHVEGSIALPLQVANAARSAIMAADLVRHGLTGPHDALEGPFGYFRLIDDGSLALCTAGLGERWRITEVSTKPYPSGRASHAVLSTVAAHRDAQVVEARVPPLIARLVGRPPIDGMSPAYARLCLPLLVALMQQDGRIDPRRFTPATFHDPDVRARAARVRIATDDNPDPNALFPQRVWLDGVLHEVPHTPGSPEAPLTAAQAAAKRALARELAPTGHDPRLFTDPLACFTEPA